MRFRRAVLTSLKLVCGAYLVTVIYLTLSTSLDHDETSYRRSLTIPVSPDGASAAASRRSRSTKGSFTQPSLTLAQFANAKALLAEMCSVADPTLVEAQPRKSLTRQINKPRTNADTWQRYTRPFDLRCPESPNLCVAGGSVWSGLWFMSNVSFTPPSVTPDIFSMNAWDATPVAVIYGSTAQQEVDHDLRGGDTPATLRPCMGNCQSPKAFVPPGLPYTIQQEAAGRQSHANCSGTIVLIVTFPYYGL